MTLVLLPNILRVHLRSVRAAGMMTRPAAPLDVFGYVLLRRYVPPEIPQPTTTVDLAGGASASGLFTSEDHT